MLRPVPPAEPCQQLLAAVFALPLRGPSPLGAGFSQAAVHLFEQRGPPAQPVALGVLRQAAWAVLPGVRQSCGCLQGVCELWPHWCKCYHLQLELLRPPP